MTEAMSDEARNTMVRSRTRALVAALLAISDAEHAAGVVAEEIVAATACAALDVAAIAVLKQFGVHADSPPGAIGSAVVRLRKAAMAAMLGEASRIEAERN